MSIAETDAILGVTISVGVLLGIVGGYVKWLRPRIRSGRHQVTAVRDAILGREATLDSITGKEISPALPGMGQRMATVEQALVSLVDSHARLDAHDELFDQLTERVEKLEEAAVERVVTKAESAAAWRAMEAAALAQPDETVD